METVIEIVFDDGHTKTARFQRNKLKLKTLAQIQAAQKSGEWNDLIPAIAGMVGLTSEEAGDLTIEQFEQIGKALEETTKVPNDGGGMSV